VRAAAASVVAVHRGTPQPIGSDDPFGQQRREGVGSGVVLDAVGHVLTNLHVADGAGSTDLRVTLPDGRSFSAEVVRRHAATNTAILQLETNGAKLPAIAIGDSDELRPGDRVFALGNLEGDVVGVSAGILSARRKSLIQVDATIGNRNAGGPLVDARGALVGLCDGGRIDRIDVAFARRGDQAKTDSGLYYTPALAAVRQVLGDAIPARSDQDLPAATASGLGDIVEGIAASMLNIYIERVVRTEAESDNPFAEPEERSFPVSLGSGVIIDPSGLALTNWHVVDAATFPDGAPRDDHVVRATQFNGRRFNVRVLAISREEDLSLIQIELEPGESVPAVRLGHSGGLEVGDRAFAIGNPEGNANTITAGIVTALEQDIRVKGRWAKLAHLIETDAAINGGNSGGALLDGAGRLIGINSAGGSAFNVTGYAISVDHVRDRVNNLLLSPTKLRAIHLGLDVMQRDDDAVVVVEVEAGGPAERADVAVGDVVKSLAGRPVSWSVGFRRALADLPPAPLELEVERDGAARTATLEPLDWPTRQVERQLGVEIERIDYTEAGETIFEAAVALHRAITGDRDGAPTEIPRSLVRIDRVSPRGTQDFADPDTIDIPDEHPLREGDLLLAVQWTEQTSDGLRSAVVEFHDVREVLDTCQQVGDYAGRLVDAWVWRDGKVQKLRIVVARLLP
jgi:S1-C subfamily serine protease